MIAMTALQAREPDGQGADGVARHQRGRWRWWACGGPERLFLFSDPHGRARLIETIQASSPLAWSLPTFTEDDWRRSIGQLGPWLIAGAAGLAAMTRWAGREPTALAGTLKPDVSVHRGCCGSPSPADAREEVSRRGTLELIWRFDGERLSGFDYDDFQWVDADTLKRLSTVVFRRAPAAAADRRYATEQFALLAGTYEALVVCRVSRAGRSPGFGA
jgi:hypothetical protein